MEQHTRKREKVGEEKKIKKEGKKEKKDKGGSVKERERERERNKIYVSLNQKLESTNSLLTNVISRSDWLCAFTCKYIYKFISINIYIY